MKQVQQKKHQSAYRPSKALRDIVTQGTRRDEASWLFLSASWLFILYKDCKWSFIWINTEEKKKINWYEFLFQM